MAVPPLAEIPSVVELPTLPPSTATGPPQVSPTPMALPALPPLFTSPMATAPPLAEAVATPPLPAEAVSMYCISKRPPFWPHTEPFHVRFGLFQTRNRCAGQNPESIGSCDFPSHENRTGSA